MMFERFTDRSRRVIVLAQEESRLVGASEIGTKHLLLGLLAEGESLAARSLQGLGVDVDVARQTVRGEASLPGSPVVAPPFTDRCKKVIEYSLREALQLGVNYIAPEHLLLGLVREGDGGGIACLVKMGVDIARVRTAVIALVTASAPAEPPANPIRRGRPKQHEDRVTTAVRLPPTLHERLVQTAAERDTSINHLMVRGTEYYLDRLPPLGPVE